MGAVALSVVSRLGSWGAGAVVLGAIVASGCALTGANDLSPEAQVRQRSTGYWQAMVAGDYATAYGYLSPGFRARISQTSYALRFAERTRWEGAEIQNVECEPERCRVSLKARFTFKGNEVFPSHSSSVDVKESWLEQDGEWWLVPKR
jgi:hypothetical protein